MAEPQFGGPWTEEKLSRLRKYLQAYMSIFSTNPRAKLLKTIYVDAFAGTGFRRETPAYAPEENSLFDVTSDSDAEALRKGSAQVALETTPPFSEYIFIEHNEEHAKNLLNLRQRFPNIAPRIEISQKDANVYLLKWCKETDWRKARAVVFLDPYGMQVEWTTIAAMADTKSIDLWILFPLGVGVNDKNYLPYWGFGQVMMVREKYDDAIRFYEKAKSLIDDDYQKPALYTDLGLAYSFKARGIPSSEKTREQYFDLANEHFQQSSALDRKYPIVWEAWANSLYHERKYADAWQKVKTAKEVGQAIQPRFLNDFGVQWRSLNKFWLTLELRRTLRDAPLTHKVSFLQPRCRNDSSALRSTNSTSGWAGSLMRER